MYSDSDSLSDTTDPMEEDDGNIRIPVESADIIIRHVNTSPIPPLEPAPPFNIRRTLSVEPEREMEVAGANTEQFDTDLPPEHLYLGNLERVTGIECLKPGKYYHRMPIFAHHSLVFPGEQIPMMLTKSVYDTTNFITDSNEGCLFGLMFFRQNGVPKDRTYGVTCQIYEKGVDNSGNALIKSKACQRFVIYHKLKENENFSIYYMMSPHRCTATVKILPEIALGDPLLSQSSNNLKKFTQNPSITKKLRRFEAGSMAWPTFIYDQYSIDDLTERAKLFLSKVKVDTMPTEPTALSFWLCKNILPNDEDRLKIFMSNSVTDRLRIIGKSMNITRLFVCKRCGAKVANCKMLFAMSKQGVQSSYCNPSGYIHETNTVYSTLNNSVYVSGRPSIEFTWFPGYAWQMLLCLNCHCHLGWKFLATKKSLVPNSFYGLSGSCIQTETETSLSDNQCIGYAMRGPVFDRHDYPDQSSTDDTDTE